MLPSTVVPPGPTQSDKTIRLSHTSFRFPRYPYLQPKFPAPPLVRLISFLLPALYPQSHLLLLDYLLNGVSATDIAVSCRCPFSFYSPPYPQCCLLLLDYLPFPALDRWTRSPLPSPTTSTSILSLPPFPFRSLSSFRSLRQRPSVTSPRRPFESCPGGR